MYNVKDKKSNLELLNNLMFNKTLSMFEYKNLPETMPQTELEKILQFNGVGFVTEFEGEIYIFSGSLGGKQDAYGNYSEFVVNNPYLNFNKSLDIKNEGVLFRNDDLSLGLKPIFNRINTMLIENEINVHIWGMNSRQQKLISASDDKTRVSAENYLTKLEKGDLSVIADDAFLDSLKSHSTNTSGGVNVKEFIELTQYLKSNLYNEVGLSSNFNMKKERLITSEVENGEDSIFTLVFTMMRNRLTAIELINQKYGLEIEVNFGSVWALKNKELVDDDFGQQGLESDNLGIVGEHLETVEEELDQDQDQDQDQDPDVDPNVDQDPESSDQDQAQDSDQETDEEEK